MTKPLNLTAAERRAIREAAEAYAASDDDPDCARIAATLRGLLKRAAKANPTPPRNGTPAEPAEPPAWLSRPYWVDPPSGHRYGFPKLYDPATDGNMTAWMIANGYPETLARKGLPCTFTAQE